VIEIILPALTWTMKEARVTRWLKSPGEQIEKGQPLIEVEMDKAVVEVESPGTGTLAAIMAEENTVVPFLALIGLLATEGEDVKAVAATAAGRQTAFATGIAKEAPAEEALSAVQATAAAASADGIRATPLAKKLARELGVNLAEVTDHGPSGRIRETDVNAHFLKAKAATPPVSARPLGPSGELVEISRVKRLTGERMRQSLDVAPHFWLHRDLDITELQNVRARLAPRIESAVGSRPSLTGMLVKVVGAALRRHPHVNASFDNERLLVWSDVNIGVAMATSDGLIVPVVHHADRKSIEEITRDLAELRRRSKDKDFRAQDLSGGTFTISNLGMFGIDWVDSIINPPEAALLSAGRMVRKPVVLQGDIIEIRPMVHLCLAIDHRVLDGADGSRFLQDLVEIAENPVFLLL